MFIHLSIISFEDASNFNPTKYIALFIWIIEVAKQNKALRDANSKENAAHPSTYRRYSMIKIKLKILARILNCVFIAKYELIWHKQKFYYYL